MESALIHGKIASNIADIIIDGNKQPSSLSILDLYNNYNILNRVQGFQTGTKLNYKADR